MFKLIPCQYKLQQSLIHNIYGKKKQKIDTSYTSLKQSKTRRQRKIYNKKYVDKKPNLKNNNKKKLYSLDKKPK